MVLAQRRAGLSQIDDQIGSIGQGCSFQGSMRREDFAACNVVATEKLRCQHRIFGGDAQATPFVELVIAGEMPEVATIADINPRLWHGYDQPTCSIAQIAQQHEEFSAIITL